MCLFLIYIALELNISTHFIHRDISWLAFNGRVLQEAQDPTVPLLERVKFLAIYSSNLNEFYRVRVASLRNVIHAPKATRDELPFNPHKVFKEVKAMIDLQSQMFSEILESQLKPALREEGIVLLRRTELNDAQKAFVEKYYHDIMSPFVQPVILTKQKIRPFLNNSAVYLAVNLEEKHHSDPRKNKTACGIVKVPSDYLPRFVTLPEGENGEKFIMFLDDMVRQCVPIIFSEYKTGASYSIKVTRDAELYIDNEFSGDLIEKIATGLAKRNIGLPSRFAFDRAIPSAMLQYLLDCLGLTREDCFPTSRYLNNYDFFSFPNFGRTDLQDEPLLPLRHKVLDAKTSIFDAIRDEEHLLHFPYQSYDYVIRFFEEAAADPNVTSIKITQYRVAERSRIMEALIRAAKSGKEVMAFVEIKARFDEETNLRWAQQLQEAGAQVLFSQPGVKVHAKIAVVTRKEDENTVDYCYLSTGNFNEKTAQIYVDLGLLTANPLFAKDIQQIFLSLKNRKSNFNYRKLLVGQANLQSTLHNLINAEIERAEKGEKAYILLKVNSIEDNSFIEHLYQASQAGVKIDLIVRGICTLKAGIPNLSENIKIISIIDRFLEHHRVYLFGNAENPILYLASADWMTRNLQHRIETAFPIENEKLRTIIFHLLDLQLNDNCKARFITPALQNMYKKSSENKPSLRAQLESYRYLENL